MKQDKVESWVQKATVTSFAVATTKLHLILEIEPCDFLKILAISS